MEFALKELPDGKGFALCDAKTGKIVPGQILTDVSSTTNVSTAYVTLRFFDLPLLKD